MGGRTQRGVRGRERVLHGRAGKGLVSKRFTQPRARPHAPAPALHAARREAHAAGSARRRSLRGRRTPLQAHGRWRRSTSSQPCAFAGSAADPSLAHAPAYRYPPATLGNTVKASSCSSLLPCTSAAPYASSDAPSSVRCAELSVAAVTRDAPQRPQRLLRGAGSARGGAAKERHGAAPLLGCATDNRVHAMRKMRQPSATSVSTASMRRSTTYGGGRCERSKKCAPPVAVCVAAPRAVSALLPRGFCARFGVQLRRFARPVARAQRVLRTSAPATPRQRAAWPA